MTTLLDVQSLGAGVQSTTIGLLIVEGVLPKPDVAIFADTGWEPRAVYDHLERLTSHLSSAGVPVEIVSRGNLRDDALSLDKATKLPAFVKNPDGSQGMGSRSCTDLYKLRPIYQRIRQMLGASTTDAGPCRWCEGTGQRVAPWRRKRGDETPGVCSVCDGDGELEKVGRPPRGAHARVSIGFSTDEITRVSDRSPNYVTLTHPLLDLGMSRTQCLAWLDSRGWGSTPKSACLGCPFHGNRAWRQIRDTDPAGWADVVDFDAEFRHDPGLRGEQYLHRSLLPLADAPIDRVERKDVVQADILDELFTQALADEGDDPIGCSPYGCRSEPTA